MLIEFSQVIKKHNISPKGVIHIGAHYAEEAKTYYDNGVEKSLWIEANPDLQKVILENIKNYPNAKIISACLSDKEETIKFNISNNGQSSSLLDLAYHKVAHPEIYYEKEIQLTTTTLNTIYEKNNISFDEYDFMNADIQGAELMMLKGADKILPNLKCIYIEVNQKELYAGCALINDIDTFLSLFGFFRCETAWCGDFGWGDAVYVPYGKNLNL